MTRPRRIGSAPRDDRGRTGIIRWSRQRGRFWRDAYADLVELVRVLIAVFVLGGLYALLRHFTGA